MLILASTSPRRQQILREAGLRHVTRKSEVPEVRLPAESPEDYVRRLAQAKARSVKPGADDIVLAADTVVVLADLVLEKPSSPADAERMLALLSGREHHVLTGICLRSESRTVVDLARTAVRFADLDQVEVRTYAFSGEPMDKAGAYAIQGLASKFVESIGGCYFNVVGLPISLVYRHLKTFPASQWRDAII